MNSFHCKFGKGKHAKRVSECETQFRYKNEKVGTVHTKLADAKQIPAKVYSVNVTKKDIAMIDWKGQKDTNLTPVNPYLKVKRGKVKTF